MRIRTLSAIAILMSLSCAAPRPVSTDPAASAVRSGHKLFRQHCAECHGADGHGTRVAPSLSSSKFVHTAEDRELFRFVTNGNLRHGMPSWSRLSDQRRWQIVAYLKSIGHAEE